MLWSKLPTPLVIGHRGAMGYAPENTLISFEEAVRRGADAIEMDVQLSKDGEIVVMHDATVERTTDGEGAVKDLLWRKIKTLNAGAWYHPEFDHQHVPSLLDVLSKFKNRKTSRRLPLSFMIELKTTKGMGGMLADAVVQQLYDASWVDRVVIISFDAAALHEVRAANKRLATGLLYSDENETGTASRLEQAQLIGAKALFPRKSCVTSKLIATAHKEGLAVATWTANTQAEMKRLLACGVDAVTTNFPDRARSLIN